MTCEKVYKELYKYQYMKYLETYGSRISNLKATIYAVKNTWNVFINLNNKKFK